MGNNFYVKHGAPIRYSAQVASTENTAWKKGRIFGQDSSGNVVVHTGAKSSTSNLVGMALENRVQSTSVGPYTTLTVTGAPSGERTSMILDEAVVVNDELQSGVSFTAGNLLYVSTTGYVTTSGNGTGSTSPVIGVAMGATAVAGDPARTLTMFFSVTY